MRKNIAMIRSLVILAAALAVLAGGPAAFGEGTDTITKSFAVGAGGRLVLDTDLGSVEVRGADAGTVEVAVHREVRRGDREKALKELDLSFEQRGNDVHVTGERERRGLSRLFDGFRERLRVRFVVTVPRPYDLDVRTSGGDVSIADVMGEVEGRTSGGDILCDRVAGRVLVKTSGGDVEVGVVDGRVEARTSGGDVRLGRVKGDLVARTSGGDIKVEDAAGSADLHTSGGSITIDGAGGALKASTSGGSVTATFNAQPASRSELKTSGGSITVRLGPGIAVSIDAHATGGRVETDIPVTIQGEIGRSSLKATANGGGPELYLRTSGGSIRIKKSA